MKSRVCAGVWLCVLVALAVPAPAKSFTATCAETTEGGSPMTCTGGLVYDSAKASAQSPKDDATCCSKAGCVSLVVQPSVPSRAGSTLVSV